MIQIAILYGKYSDFDYIKWFYQSSSFCFRGLYRPRFREKFYKWIRHSFSVYNTVFVATRSSSYIIVLNLNFVCKLCRRMTSSLHNQWYV